MMQLIDFLPLQNVGAKIEAQSKKRALEMICGMAANALENPKLTFLILEAMLTRERLGSTGIGHGVAIPHCRTDAVEKPLAVLISLQKGIDYNGIDNQPVDIILGLLMPPEASDVHIELLAWIAKQLSQQNVLDNIRSAKSNQILYNIIANLPYE